MRELSRRELLRRGGQAALGLGAVAAFGHGAAAAELTEARKTMRVPMQVPYQPGFITWVAATTACLRALGVHCDAVDVAGHSGYAFLLNICDGVGPCGPTNFDMERLLRGVRSLGRSTLLFRGGCGQAGATPEAREELSVAHGVVEREIAAGRPCVLYGFGVAEFGAVVGLQDGAYLAAGQSHPVPPESLSTPGGAHVLGFPSALRVDPVQTDLRAVLNARETSRSATPNDASSLTPIANGQAGYDRWIAALESRRIGAFHGYNAQIWAEAKRYARDFVSRLAPRNQPVERPLRQAAAAYVEVAAAMEQVADLFTGRPEAEVDSGISARAATVLRTAKAAEAKATEALSEAAAKWPIAPKQS